VLERRDREVVLRVDAGLLRRLDAVDDVLVARRAELGAELVAAEAGDRAGGGDRRALLDDERLVDVVVRVAEGDDLRALGRVGDLVDVEIEALLAGGERLRERDIGPADLRPGEAELPGDRVRDGGLVALAAPRVAPLPRRRR